MTFKFKTVTAIGRSISTTLPMQHTVNLIHLAVYSIERFGGIWTLLNQAMDFCIRKVSSFKNMPIKVHANLLKKTEHLPNTVHVKYNMFNVFTHK